MPRGIAAPYFSNELVIESKKGHLVITDRYPGFVSHQIVELGYLKSAHGSDSESVAFNVQPRRTGQLLIGSSREPGVGDKSIDRGIVKRMLERAFQYLPDLPDMSALRVSDRKPALNTGQPALYRPKHEQCKCDRCGRTRRTRDHNITWHSGDRGGHCRRRQSKIPRGPYSPGRL